MVLKDFHPNVLLDPTCSWSGLMITIQGVELTYIRTYMIVKDGNWQVFSRVFDYFSFVSAKLMSYLLFNIHSRFAYSSGELGFIVYCRQLPFSWDSPLNKCWTETRKNMEYSEGFIRNSHCQAEINQKKKICSPRNLWNSPNLHFWWLKPSEFTEVADSEPSRRKQGVTQ